MSGIDMIRKVKPRRKPDEEVRMLMQDVSVGLIEVVSLEPRNGLDGYLYHFRQRQPGRITSPAILDLKIAHAEDELRWLMQERLRAQNERPAEADTSENGEPPAPSTEESPSHPLSRETYETLSSAPAVALISKTFAHVERMANRIRVGRGRN